MSETTVVNVYRLKHPVDDYVYIGRPSKWGNPFTHLRTNTKAEFVVATREEAIAKYESYLLGRQDLLDSLHELKGKKLGCYCKPDSCHGDILKKYVDKL